MKKIAISSSMASILLVIAGTAWAQGAPSGAPNAPSGALSQTPTTSLQEQNAEKFNIYTSKPGEKKPDAAKVHEAALKDAGALVGQLHLSCVVTDASYVAHGPTVVNGKTVQTTTFEVACGNGMGYFVVSQEPELPTALSCFTAEAVRTADVAAGNKPGVVCQLPANADIKTMATSIVNHTGHACTVRDLKRIGQSAKSNTEYNEVACADGTGYMLASALPGSTNAPIVVSCHNSALQGIACKMSDNGELPPTIQDFKAALAQHNVRCDATDVRSIGKQTESKRHVVEFLCPQQQPGGLVAFIPLNGNTAPFEAVDCATAAKQRISCTLTKK
ncbi:MAG: hypothetical protein WCA81_11465 [Rhizomicrobium sp.]